LLLLVDDEEPLREVMAEALRDVLGYPILEARDGLEALDLFRERGDEIALVLMDAKMPRMTGTESFQRMKEIRPDLKAILCSGYGEEFGQSTAQGFGFRGFLKKPFSLSALEEAIQNALGS
jgi:CheY-like chemotaxis protein